MTIRQDRLPRGVPTQYSHKSPTEPGNSTAKCTCYTEPIVMVTNKEEPETKKKYQKVHVSFQSKSSCNIQAVNILSSVSKFEETKERALMCTYKPLDKLCAGDENMR
eukprot:8723270-Ditylum_brightwellii.AAC.1